MNKYRTIYREDIQAHLQAGTSMRLVEALPHSYFADGHLPGAVNVPHAAIRNRAHTLLPDKEELIVVYCANKDCKNSAIAANTLTAMGYNNVAAYEGGKQDWIDGGLPVEKLN